MSNPQSLNRFSYVRNNPLIFIDPTGHTECRLEPEECKYLQNLQNNNSGGSSSSSSGGDVALSTRAQKLISFAKSVKMTPEEVIGIGLGHEMFHQSKKEQAIHMQAFRNGFIQYADANCSGNRTYNCMLNYFSGYQSVKGQFDAFWGNPKDYRFAQDGANLTDNLLGAVIAGKSFTKDFMSTISSYSYDPVNNIADRDLPVNTGVIYVQAFHALKTGPPTADMGFLIVKPAVCPKSGASGYSLVYNWYGQQMLDAHGITACD